jgi:hypothetical protein
MNRFNEYFERLQHPRRESELRSRFGCQAHKARNVDMMIFHKSPTSVLEKKNQMHKK